MEVVGQGHGQVRPLANQTLMLQRANWFNRVVMTDKNEIRSGLLIFSVYTYGKFQSMRTK